MLTFSLDLTGRRVLAVGGGRVTARRVVDLLAENAEVVVVAPELCSALVELRDRITWHRRPFAEPDLDGAWLVHTASGSRFTDRRVARLAAERNVFCINATEGDHGTAAVPARARLDVPGGSVQVAVSSGDPRRSVCVRDEIGRHLAGMDLRPHRPHAGWVAIVATRSDGEPALSRRGSALLHSADLVVVDDRVAPGVLTQLPGDVPVLDITEQSGQPAVWPLVVERAHSGQGVVRLTGEGDTPRLLAEEMACWEAGIPVESVEATDRQVCHIQPTERASR